MLLTTTQTIEGRHIVENKGIVFGIKRLCPISAEETESIINKE